MSADPYNGRAATVVSNTYWSKVEASATFSARTKSTVGGRDGAPGDVAAYLKALG